MLPIASGVRRSAQNEREIGRSSLRHGHKRFKARIRFAQAAGKGEVINNADNFENSLSLDQYYLMSLSDRTFVGPEGTCGRFIDDDDFSGDRPYPTALKVRPCRKRAPRVSK